MTDQSLPVGTKVQITTTAYTRHTGETGPVLEAGKGWHKVRVPHPQGGDVDLWFHNDELEEI